ncbi:MAG: altronate dehydratase, partial [Sagittula sp.]
MTTVRLSEADNVVTAVTALEAGSHGATQLIPRGHKLATRPIARGDAVRKYAQVIGYASTD